MFAEYGNYLPLMKKYSVFPASYKWKIVTKNNFWYLS